MDRLRKISVIFLSLIFVSAAFASSPQFADDAKTLKLHWKTPEIKIYVSNSLKNSDKIKSDENILETVKRSLENWEKVADVEFSVAWSNKQTIGNDGVNLITIAETPENFGLFSNNQADDIAARTRVFFNKQGIISESDIALNPSQLFSDNSTFETFDLESILTHEIGHLLGLDHSSVLGATMFANQRKNGVDGLSSLTPRTLSEDDRSGVRAIYGAFSEEKCCGSVRGSLVNQTGKPLKNANVWLEEISTGRVFAAGNTNDLGKFRLEGLLEGNYRLFAQQNTDIENERINNKTISFDVLIAEQIKIERAKTFNIDSQIKTNVGQNSLKFIGMNEQLAQNSLLLNAGQKYFIYLGGKKSGNSNPNISFTSQFFTSTSNSLIRQDYDDDLTSFGIEAIISKNTPNGEYTVRLQNPDGGFSSLIGAITIDDFANGNYSNFWR